MCAPQWYRPAVGPSSSADGDATKTYEYSNPAGTEGRLPLKPTEKTPSAVRCGSTLCDVSDDQTSVLPLEGSVEAIGPQSRPVAPRLSKPVALAVVSRTWPRHDSVWSDGARAALVRNDGNEVLRSVFLPHRDVRSPNGKEAVATATLGRPEYILKVATIVALVEPALCSKFADKPVQFPNVWSLPLVERSEA